MSDATGPPTGLRLPSGRVTVLLGPEAARRHLVHCLDGAGAAVLTVASHPSRSARERLAALAQAAAHRPALVLVDRLTDGLSGEDRRAVLAELRTLAAAGPAVLVDDADPVAALAVAHGALRAHPDGSLHADDLAGAIPAAS